MTNLPPPDHEKSELGFDEWIGVIVALTTIGAILIATLSQRDKLFNFSQLIGSSKNEQTKEVKEEPILTPPLPVKKDLPEEKAIAPEASPFPSTPLPASPRVSAENQTPSPKVVPLAPVPSVSTRETSTATPTPTPTETSTETVSFTDVADDFWARPYIETVVNRKIMSGFPDGTFKPNNPINRAEFAALLKKAFEQKATLQTPKFKDISNDFWGFPAIQETTKTGFLRGYPNNTFQPKQSIPKVQVLVALASGLDLKTTQTPQKVLQSYQDAPQIPKYATEKVSAATEAGIVVNYPNPKLLNPNKNTTRAEAAALIYQALVEEGKVEAIPSEYVVKP